MAFCSTCGVSMEDADKFCASCGSVRSAVRPVVPEPELEPERPSPANEPLPPDPTAPISSAPAALKYRMLSWAVDGALVVAAFVSANAIHQLLGVAVLAFGVMAYYVLLVGGSRHATIGHTVAKLRVVDAESLEPIDVRTAGLRAAINAVMALPLGVPLLLNVPIQRRYQGALLHDLSSGTKAVRDA